MSTYLWEGGDKWTIRYFKVEFRKSYKIRHELENVASVII